MGFDPISLGLMGAGLGASFLGNGMAAGQSARAGLRDMRARNAVLEQQTKKLEAYAGQNWDKFNANMANMTPEQQTAIRQAAVADRTGKANAQIAGAKLGGPVIAGSSSPQVAADYAARMGEGTNYATNIAGKEAALRGYDDQFLTNKLNDSDLARRIDVTNNFARGVASLTRPLQDFASAAAYKAPGMGPQLLQGIGGILSGMGAEGLAGYGPAAGLGARFSGAAGGAPISAAQTAGGSGNYMSKLGGGFG